MDRIIKVALLVAVLAAAGFAGVRLMPRAAAAPANDHAAHGMTAQEHITHMAAAGDIHANHALDEIRWAAFARQAAPATSSLPADDMGAADRLAKSPRKGEYVTINVGATPMRAWVVRPQGTAPAPVVVVIQEIFGLSDWIRGVADQLAADGFIAVAPDLLSGMGPNGGDSSSIGQQELMKVTLSLPPAEVINRLKAAREWGLKQKGSNGKSATVGFCFGGAQSFAMAVAEPSLNAAVVYYGDAPNANAGGGRGAPFAAADSLANIKAPVLGLYGGLKEDGRIGATIEPTRMKMKELGKTYDVHIFEGAAHGFLRAQTGNNGANLKATQQAWPLTVAWIKKYAG
jgi:carboxymethylenebutenolidase